ncbi:MFS transporter [Nocardia sp. CA2R105]|uniref:MFS transporter n=1 Tax=Nocardia coffeae TaxID=2873381 RepID=UPI001CA75F18|nr:MFS transporter [Nocardia coffeae]MBY8863085.1 MFS transporter [Nocardia coffeae]
MQLHTTPGTPAADGPIDSVGNTGRTRMYPWLVFVLTFALLLADYMSRQVLSAVFPVLKTQWGLTDSRLGSLNSVVALMVGLLTFPLSLLADRWGRVKSLVLMATLWSVATLLCAVAANYHQMLGARFLVGVGEAAYGSVGIALVLGIFGSRVHAALGGAFMAGGSFGSVLGVAAGGAIAVHLGWRWSFVTMALVGLVLAALFGALVSERKLARYVDRGSAESVRHSRFRAPISTLFTNPAVWCAYVGGGAQLFTAAVLLAWTPSFFNRVYGLATDTAAAAASGVVLLVGAGMVCCGVVADRIGRRDLSRKWPAAVAFCAVSLICLMLGFSIEPGPAQLILIGIGAWFSGGSSGPIAAVVADLTHSSVRASAMGMLTLSDSLLGMALGPFVVGLLADRCGLTAALRLAPLAYLVAIAALVAGRCLYPAGLRKLAAVHDR